MKVGDLVRHRDIPPDMEHNKSVGVVLQITKEIMFGGPTEVDVHWTRWQREVRGYRPEELVVISES